MAWFERNNDAPMPLQVSVGFQDGANVGVFTRPPAGSWELVGVAGMPVGCTRLVPAAVRQLWHLVCLDG
jgi:hypothetical protein